MTLAKSASPPSFATPAPETIESPSITLDHRLSHLATQAADSALTLLGDYQPLATDKTQATWQLLRNTQPVQLLLAAALAVLSIALVMLVTTFGGLIILLLKLAALTLAAVAVGQWIFRGLSWADGKLPAVDTPE